jgi:DNA-binding transcriptional regulator YdaS (Cro superfamily)
MQFSIEDPVIKKEQAIALAGSPARLAKALGIARSSVSCWGEFVPPLQAYRLIQIYPELKIMETRKIA